MRERIEKHLIEDYSIRVEIVQIIGYCDPESPILLEERRWGIDDNMSELFIHDNTGEEDYFIYELSSEGNKGKRFYIGEKDGYTYALAYDGDWDNSFLFVLNNKNRI